MPSTKPTRLERSVASQIKLLLFMVNDILEQLGEEYFRYKGYFTQHNVRYRPNKKGSAFAVSSDIDIIAVHPQPKQNNLPRVCVASCKSWNTGLNIKNCIKEIEADFVKTKKIFREVALKDWSEALKQEVKKQTGDDCFTFYVICVKFDQELRGQWENYSLFKQNLTGCEIRLLDMKTMVDEVMTDIKVSPPEHSELTRLLQLIKASGGNITY